MTAIEIKRILKDGALILAVLAAIGLAIAFSDQDAYLAPTLEMFLLLYVSFLGWSMFERERQENAVEYVLSLPLSRSRLLLLKFLPRLLSVSLLLLVYLRLHHSWRLPSLLSPLDFAILYGGFFLLSIAFSVSLKNFITAFFIVCLLTVGQVLLIRLLDPGREIGPAILQASLTALVFPLFFFVLFQGYDVKPVSYFNKKFFPGLLLLAGLIAGFLFLTAPPGWKNLTLTSRGLILKNSCGHSEITLKNGRHRFPVCLIALRETSDGRALYCLTRKPRKDEACAELALGLLDLESGDLKTLYAFEADWSVTPGYPGEIGSIRGATYSLFLQNSRLKKAMLLQVENGRVRKIPVAGGFYDPHISYVLYLDGAPPRFVMISEPRLYRLDASGGVAELASGKSFSVWRDKVLLFEPSGMNLYQAGEECKRLRQWRGNYKKSLRRISGYESRSVIYHLNRDYFWLDMEEQKESRLQVNSPPYTYQQSGDILNVVFANGSVFTIRGIRPDRQSEAVWSPGFQPSGIRISPYGLLVFRDQEYKVYPFND